jgi:hypothetical protein
MLLSNDCETAKFISVKMHVSVRQGDCRSKSLGDHSEVFTDCTHEQLIGLLYSYWFINQ